ncbi:MAG: LuxR C-terminal-related transcriptional regulator, partial [Chloroflexota bacterium]
GIFSSFAQAVGPALFFTPQGTAPFERILPFMKLYLGGEHSLIQMGISNIEAYWGLFRGDLDAAWAAAQNSREIARYYDGFAWAENVIDSVLLSVFLIREDYAGFDRYYRECVARIMNRDTGRYLLSEYQYRYGQRLLSEGQLETVETVIEQIEASKTIKEHEALLLVLRGHLARRKGDLDDALHWMKQAVELQSALQRFYPSYSALGLALVYWQRDEHGLAFKTLQDALNTLAKWNYPGIILLEGREIVPLLEAAAERGIYPELCHFCLNILELDREDRPIEIPGSTDSFTPREAEILRLMVGGASNRDIAETLVISENTVKSHISHILSKLGAKSRTEAVARVRALGIVL